MRSKLSARMGEDMESIFVFAAIMVVAEGLKMYYSNEDVEVNDGSFWND